MGNGQWVTKFTSVERDSVQNLEAVVNTFEWSMTAIAGLVSILLFLLAANRCRQGDYSGAFLSSIAAVICAIAPLISLHFIN